MTKPCGGQAIIQVQIEDIFSKTLKGVIVFCKNMTMKYSNIWANDIEGTYHKR